MKGQAPAVWIAGASVLAVIGVLSFSLAYQVQSVVRGQNERTVIEALNEIEFIKKAISQATTYSSYQSAYDTLKYGGYMSAGCIPEKLNDLPYWKTYEESCEPTDLNAPFENKLKEIFGEYMSKIQEQADKINIKIPSYQISSTVEESGVEVSAESSGKITFESDNQLFSDVLNIRQNIKLPIERLIKFGIEEFVEKDPFTPKIQAAKDAMASAPLDNSLMKNPGWATPDLNDGALTGNCKSTNFKICADPGTTPDFTYNLPQKPDLITENCESAFRANIVENVNSLNKNPEYHIQPIDASIETKPNLVEIEMDLNNEDTCETTVPQQNSNSCDCIKWVCTGDTPVVFGTDVPTLTLPSTTEVPETRKCSGCASATGSTCTQFTGLVCPSGYDPRDVDGDGSVERNECVKLFDKICPTDHPNQFTGQCYIVETCGDNEECGGPVTGCYADSGNRDHDVCWYDPVAKVCPAGRTPHGTECWGETTSKQCPADAPIEFGTTERCYKTPQASACILHKTLYTKTCDHNYKADVTTLLKIKDTENKYPVYDKDEENTKLRNLELQFYVASGDNPQ